MTGSSPSLALGAPLLVAWVLVAPLVVGLLVAPLVAGLTHRDWLTLRTERAYILSTYNHVLTSSTLSWAGVEDIVSGRIPTSRLVLVEDSAVCRVRDGNRQRAGRTDLSGSCIAGLGWVKHQDYQVLVDPTSLSRYEWRYWDMYRVPEPGTVSFNHRTYVASFTLESGRQIIGELDLTRGLNGNIKAYVAENITELSTQGLALVELEPVQYIIDNVELNTDREKMETKRVVLGKVRLQREPDSSGTWEHISGRIQYSHPVSHDWGHIPGTLKGLPAVAELGDKRTNFSWGMEWDGDEAGDRTVGAYLLPGTSVDVTLKGTVGQGEVPFQADLTQVYRDGERRKTRVEGTLTHTKLDNLVLETGEASFVESGLPAPQYTTTTSTTTITTTTTTGPVKSFSEHLTDNTLLISSSESVWSPYSLQSLPPTLFPPTEPTTTKPNPLRKFYPVEDDVKPEIVTAAKFLDHEEVVAAGGEGPTLKSSILLIFITVSVRLIFLI